MAQGIEIDRSTLDEWINNFRNNTNLPFSTNFGAFTKEQVGEFIKDAAPTYDGVEPGAFRIYPVRYPIASTGPADPNMELEPGSTYSRPAFVFVPADNDSGEILENKDRKVYVLPFGYGGSADPATRSATAGFPSSGPKLCPPKC
ncbi:hypothetical protein [Flavihumibacter solisilvae]|uniref:Uncharacterized protein n=1 Tax=Flavihumibacter solisilvae TaxID=1349421 RepID=A0A0C1L2I6_9BACT|nr:hypothetical protein [Flavihumibacter solisilvae]KIC93816.1 hypothetical protein OI18_14535 [Flavihumibacter solisilvae]